MLRMDDTHPGIRTHFQEGMLAVRRTNKEFSGNYQDLTLEQTINRDAANTKHGNILVAILFAITDRYLLFIPDCYVN